MDIAAELDIFDRWVRERKHDEAFYTLLTLLKASSVHRDKPDLIFDPLNREEAAYVATRLVSTTFQLLLDDGFCLSEQAYCALSLYGRNFLLVTQLTPYKTADHVIRQLIGQDASGQRKEQVSIHAFRKVLFLWSIYSGVILPLRDYLKAYPELMKYVVFNALTLNCYLDSEVTERREQLLDLIAEEGFDFRLDDFSLTFAANPWMYCAYPHTPRKHEIKRDINRAYRRYALEKGVTEPVFPVRRPRVDKPVVVIVVEQMTHFHAVFRCYAKALESLRQKFQTVAVAIKSAVDDAAMSIFDKVVYLEEDAVEHLRKNVGRLLKQKPDMIIYLSLGMQHNTIPMATLRLAPIQVMLMAHPCTSRIDTIDYAIIHKGVAPTRQEFSERMVLVPNGSFAYTSKDPVIAEKPPVKLSDLKGEDKTIRIAIPSFAVKLTGRFIRVLNEVRQQSKRKVEYHFFPYLKGISLVQFRETMERVLPGSVVHMPYGYRKYLSVIGACDFHMSPFPFGNTNGNVDSARMGLPIITMDGEGIESRIDVAMLQRMGMPSWTVAEDEDAYVRLAVSLVDDDEQRLQLASVVRDINLEKVFFNTGLDGVFVNTLYSIYRHHETLILSDKKVFEAEDLIAMGNTANA